MDRPPDDGADHRDVFICHANEDKSDVARPLAAALQRRGLTVWLDELDLKIGDSLLRKIDDAVITSTFGLVILSPSFFRKSWTRRELDSLTTREMSGEHVVVLPVWHEVDAAYVSRYSPALADKLAANTADGLESIADQVAARAKPRDSLPFSYESAQTGDVSALSLADPATWITLVQEDCFCISDRAGDIRTGLPHGLFYRDTRVLSEFEVQIDDERVAPLAPQMIEAFAAQFLARSVRPGAPPERSIMLRRSRYVGRGLREDIRLRNFGDEPSLVSLDVRIHGDFEELGRVREGRQRLGSAGVKVESTGVELSVSAERRGLVKRVRIQADGASSILGNVIHYDAVVPPRSWWATCLLVSVVIDGEEIEPRYRCGEPVERAAPAERLRTWRQHAPSVACQHEGLADAVVRSADDLGALRIFDPEYPERTVVAAGAPWFMTLFGRNSLITSWMALLVDPELALGVLQTLARFQGNEVDPRYDEEPGKILHEMRFGEAATLTLGGGRIYYGTADATPLFVMLLGELRRWGLAHEVVDQLLPAADRALSWITDYGDRDGDGYVEYQRATDRGLVNQGWKDSWDGVRFASGELAKAPIALAEVQGYVYGAYLARAHFADEDGDGGLANRYRTLAADLKRRFNEDFWLPDRGWFAMGLDHLKRPIDALASNMGHCLWTGIVDEERAGAVAAHLVGQDLFSGWGVRTLAESTSGYSPISYHCGSVWPHDTAIIAAGLMRYGYVEEAHRVIHSLVDAGTAFGGRLPELFTGISREEFPSPVSYPTACVPYGMAAASPLLLLRTLLRFDPWIPHGKLWLAPELPEWIPYLRVDGIPLAGSRVTIEARPDGGGLKIDGLPPEIEVVSDARRFR